MLHDDPFNLGSSFSKDPVKDYLRKERVRLLRDRAFLHHELDRERRSNSGLTRFDEWQLYNTERTIADIDDRLSQDY